jgi:hypothetical protein
VGYQGEVVCQSMSVLHILSMGAMLDSPFSEPLLLDVEATSNGDLGIRGGLIAFRLGQAAGRALLLASRERASTESAFLSDGNVK